MNNTNNQPMDPSISISISLFNSTAYSNGKAFVIGSIKPATMRDIASAGFIPRDDR